MDADAAPEDPVRAEQSRLEDPQQNAADSGCCVSLMELHLWLHRLIDLSQAVVVRLGSLHQSSSGIDSIVPLYVIKD
ncbi:hypothetical protein EAI_13520 [Harpegnathos saltator]|uniref:Uncharacterized protein n=1 Tax=Harpegnathos saltator TaxID=610380 RepID=E2B9D8_HARSA|nr:hypothetical protein EAI_13520 [Harpegnathos saltator]